LDDQEERVARNVKLFIAGGLTTAEIGQWSGRALAFPRTQLGPATAHAVAQGPGVYVLGDDEDAIYIGEADHVAKRVLQHKEDFWSRACLFTDSSLTKGHVRYLEARLLQVARRCTLLNGTRPVPPKLSPGEAQDMEHFIEHATVLLPLLGFRFVGPLTTKATEDVATFHLRTVGAEARAREVEDSFVVLAGSTMRREGTATWTNGRRLRERLIEEQVLVVDGDSLRLREDVPFQSPSTAASVVAASNMNGRTAWKLPSGESYAEWADARLNGTDALAPRA
jgi:hypothetical protein